MNAVNYYQVGRRIASRRELADLTQKQLADLAGLTQAAIARIEKGKAPGVRVESLARIADVLGCSVDYLLRRGEHPASDLEPAIAP